MRMLRVGLFGSLAAVAAASTLSACSGTRLDAAERARMPDELVANYELFSTKCSKCHSLARPLGAGITDDAQWEMYVTRMRLQPGSGISPEDQAQILKFLRWHASELRRTKGIQLPASASASPPPPPPPAPPASAGVQGAP